MSKSLARAIALAAFGMTLAFSIHTAITDFGQFLFEGFHPGFAAVGAFVLWKRPTNRVGWILLGIGAFPVLAYVTQAYPRSLPGSDIVIWLVGKVFYLGVGLVPFLILLFPTGHLPSGRWRLPTRVAAASLLVVMATDAIRPTKLEPGGPSNPFGVPALLPFVKIVFPLSAAILIVFGFGALIHKFVRFRKSTGDERRQLKWFAYSCTIMPAMLILANARMPILLPLAFTVGLNAIAVAIGVAVLKYRLYDIDVVINKTVVYSGLAAFITLVYVGVVVGIGTLVGAGDKPNVGLSLAATAIVAVAFQPVRQRVQRFANKLVYGERVTPYEAITGFSHRMAESLSFEQVLPQMAEAAAKGVGGTRSRARLFLPGGGEQIVNWPPDETGNSFDRTIAVTHQGETVGEIAVAKAPGEQINKNEEKLLADLASQAGLAMRNLRLTGELQQKLVELQESRKRIVAAQDEERRRMERDIHDGAQQQLVAMSVKLGLAKNLLAQDPAKATLLLDDLKIEAGETVESLRDLARGLFPQVLTERGLAAAVDSHVSKMGLDARVEDRLTGSRFDLDVEANVFFVIREALQNASKHAPGAPISITLGHGDGFLDFSVKDDGPGFDLTKVSRGSGLQNMPDRIEALGGTLRVDSRPGLGTEIVGRVRARALEGAS